MHKAQPQGRPAIPDEAAARQMCAHLAEHGLKPDLRRHVWWGGRRLKNPTLSFFPRTPAKRARFFCQRCPGTVFLLGEPAYGNPERNAIIRRRHPEVWELAKGVEDRARLEEITEDFDRGLHAKTSREQVAGLKQQQAKQAGRAPLAAKRIANCTAWMLERYEQIGNREDVWAELVALRETDRKAHLRLVGDDRPLTPGTVQRWWREEILKQDRSAAKQRYRDRLHKQLVEAKQAN